MAQFELKFWRIIFSLNFSDPDYHRAWLKHGSKRKIDLKLLISYLPTANFPIMESKFVKTRGGKRKRKSPRRFDEKNNELRLAATIIGKVSLSNICFNFLTLGGVLIKTEAAQTNNQQELS